MASGRARSNGRPKLPPEQVVPTAIEALTRANVAAECLAEAVRRVREVTQAASPLDAPLLTAALRHLTAAGSELVQARSHLDRYLDRPTFLDGAKMTEGRR